MLLLDCYATLLHIVKCMNFNTFYYKFVHGIKYAYADHSTSVNVNIDIHM